MMKFPLILLLTTVTTPTYSFTPHYQTTLHPPTRLSYQHPSNNSEQDSSQSDPAANVWTVLANTERWISDTLDKSNKAANDRNKKLRQQQQQKDEQEQQQPLHYANDKKKKKKLEPRDNPYARKEVSYVCETGEDLCVVVGGIFRRVREARELGESHGKSAGLRIGKFFLILSLDCLYSLLGCIGWLYNCNCLTMNCVQYPNIPYQYI